MTLAKEVILIFQIGSLGDTVISMPCYREIARRHPDAERYLLTNFPVASKAVPAAAILTPAGLIAGTIEYPMPIRRPTDIAKLYSRIRKLKATTLYYLLPEKRITKLIRHYAFFRICGIGRICGVPWSRDLRFPREVIEGKLWESEASRLLRTIGANTQPGPPAEADRDLGLSDEERIKAELTLKQTDGLGRFVAISVGGKIPINDWGNKNWAYLLSELSSEDHGLGAIFVGSADERSRNDLLAEAWHGPKFNSCGLLSPRETAAILERASLFIGHDTGTLHLAAAVRTRVIGIYSAREVPGKWFSDRLKDVFFYHHIECFGCKCVEIAECPKGNLCIAAIDPDEVFEAAKAELVRSIAH